MYPYKSAFKSFVTPLRIIWMTESAYELKTFNSVTCEHILIVYFDYAFQNHMSYPIIGFLVSSFMSWKLCIMRTGI